VPISEKNRKYFEGIGLDAIKREPTLGNNFYISIDAATQAEAKEWVAEQEEKKRQKWWQWIIANIGTPAAIISAVAGTLALIIVLINSNNLKKRWAQEDEAKRPRVHVEVSGDVFAGQFREINLWLEPHPPDAAAWVK
jgi:hypothetical protein